MSKHSTWSVQVQYNNLVFVLVLRPYYKCMNVTFETQVITTNALWWYRPEYSGKQMVRALRVIFSSNRSFLLRKRMIEVSVNHLLLQIESNSFMLSCIRFWKERQFTSFFCKNLYTVTIGWRCCPIHSSWIQRWLSSLGLALNWRDHLTLIILISVPCIVVRFQALPCWKKKKAPNKNTNPPTSFC